MLRKQWRGEYLDIEEREEARQKWVWSWWNCGHVKCPMNLISMLMPLIRGVKKLFLTNLTYISSNQGGATKNSLGQSRSATRKAETVFDSSRGAQSPMWSSQAEIWVSAFWFAWCLLRILISLQFLIHVTMRQRKPSSEYPGGSFAQRASNSTV